MPNFALTFTHLADSVAHTLDKPFRWTVKQLHEQASRSEKRYCEKDPEWVRVQQMREQTGDDNTIIAFSDELGWDEWNYQESVRTRSPQGRALRRVAWTIDEILPSRASNHLTRTVERKTRGYATTDLYNLDGWLLTSTLHYIPALQHALWDATDNTETLHTIDEIAENTKDRLNTLTVLRNDYLLPGTHEKTPEGEAVATLNAYANQGWVTFAALISEIRDHREPGTLVDKLTTQWFTTFANALTDFTTDLIGYPPQITYEQWVNLLTSTAQTLHACADNTATLEQIAQLGEFLAEYHAHLWW